VAVNALMICSVCACARIVALGKCACALEKSSRVKSSQAWLPYGCLLFLYRLDLTRQVYSKFSAIYQVVGLRATRPLRKIKVSRPIANEDRRSQSVVKGVPGRVMPFTSVGTRLLSSGGSTTSSKIGNIKLAAHFRKQWRNTLARDGTWDRK